MENLKNLNEPPILTNIVLCTPNDLRDIANKLEAKAKVSSDARESVVYPLTNSITLVYDVTSTRPVYSGVSSDDMSLNCEVYNVQ